MDAECTIDKQNQHDHDLLLQIDVKTTYIAASLDKMDKRFEIMDVKIKESEELANKKIEDIDRSFDTKIKNVEKRISDLENWRWYLVGIAVAIGFVIRTAWSYIISKI